MRGAWIWLRPGNMPRVEQCLPHLDGVVYPLQRATGPIHVGPTHRRWLEEWVDAGRSWWAMDWLSGTSSGHVEDLCARARELGASGLVDDAEPEAGWRGRVREAVARRLALAEHRGSLDLAITDRARGGIGDRVLGALLAEVEGHRPIGIPQSYDPAGRYAGDYHQLGVDYWRDLGAERVVLGVGLWLRAEKRHRTPDELRRHLATIPPKVQGVCGWYASASALDDGDAETADDLLPVLGEHRASAALRPTDPAPLAEPPRVRLVAVLEALAVEAKAAGDLDAAHELAHVAARLARA